MKTLVWASMTLSGSLLLAFSSITAHAANSKGPLFSKGEEVFDIQNQAGKTPVFRVLDDSTSERALAIAVITTLNSQSEVQPKIPQKDYLDLKFETMKFAPNGKNKIDLSIKLSGYEVALEKTVDRADFLAGKPISIPFPSGRRNVAFFDVNASGNLKFRFDSAKEIVVLDEVRAKMDFDSPLGDEGEESIKFSGRGIRQ
ncbi:MAG: hypothetical protein V4692_16750 [Bdellovibrionota bacterium]